MKAHIESRKGKNIRKEIILFNLKQEEYIMWLYEQLKNGTYKHSRYATFYVTEPKLRKIEKSRYIDRIVHTWLAENFLLKYFVTQFIPTSFACIKGKGMHRAAFCVQKYMKKAKQRWENYYIIKKRFMQYRKIKISDKYRKTSCDKDEIKLSATLVYLYCVLRLFVL